MIKNIIFDFGDVFINLNKQATYNELATLGVTEITEELIKIYHHYEMGFLTTDEFVTFFHQKFHIPVTDLINAWNAILLDFPKYRFRFLKNLVHQHTYRLFLLSNTNDLHITWIQKDWGNTLYNEFKNCFEKFYLSHEIHLRKPTTAIYEFVLQENQLNPTETIFIDDTAENTKTAKKLGLHTWTINPDTEDIVHLLDRQEFM